MDVKLEILCLMVKKILAFFILMISIQITGISQGFNPYAAYGQPTPKKNTLRTILNKITWTLESGYGTTFYGHQLEQGLLVRKSDKQYISVDGTGYYSDWLNAPVFYNNLSVDDNDARVSADTMQLKFNGVGTGVPLNVGLHVEFYRFKIGLGAGFEFHNLPQLNTPTDRDVIGTYKPEPKSTIFTKFYGMFGGKFYRIGDFHYYVDLMAGIMKHGSAFETSDNSLFFNIGVPIEYEFSEYFRGYIRPALETKNYTVSLGEGGYPVNHHQPAAFVTIGIRYNIPDTPRCPIKSCRTQLKHRHKHLGSKEYRGQPFYKKQNPKIGENYPELHRYKGNNKRKRSGGY